MSQIQPLKQFFMTLVLVFTHACVLANTASTVESSVIGSQGQPDSSQHPDFMDAKDASRINSERVGNLLGHFCLKTAESSTCLDPDQIVVLLTQGDATVRITRLAIVAEPELPLYRIVVKTDGYSLIYRLEANDDDSWLLTDMHIHVLGPLMDTANDALTMQKMTISPEQNWRLDLGLISQERCMKQLPVNKWWMCI